MDLYTDLLARITPPEACSTRARVAFGVTILARVVRDGLRLLRPGGWLCLEVGLGQGPAMARRLVQSGAYGEPRSFADAAGEVRALAAQVKSR